MANGTERIRINGYVTAAAKGPCREELELVRCGLAQLAAQYPQCVEVEGNCR